MTVETLYRFTEHAAPINLNGCPRTGNTMPNADGQDANGEGHCGNASRQAM